LTVVGDELLELLKRCFGEDMVKKEWNIATKADDFWEILRGKSYIPRLDYAIGPFNITGSVLENIKKIDNAYMVHFNLIQSFIKKSLTSINGFDENWNHNPRCFIAIEVENRSSIKHRLGSMLNASFMGKIGIIVAQNERVLESFRRLLTYLCIISKSKLKKTRILIPKNIIIIREQDFKEELKRYFK